MINNMRINQTGSSRIKEIEKFRVKKDEKGITQNNYLIEKLQYIEFPGYKLIFCALESKDALIFDYQSKEVIHKFQFKSNYCFPKHKKLNLQNASTHNNSI